MSSLLLQSLTERLFAAIPMARVMGVEVVAWDGRALLLGAPLAPNHNDKGTGFAGSLATLATLAGWALATLLAEKLAGPCQVAIFESELRYLRPVTGDFTARCTVPDEVACERLSTTLRARGRGRVALTVEVLQGDEVKVNFRGRYAVWKADQRQAED
ncbi:YiiD C-terminal domain-containing protein [Desulfuromonas sp. CSMB_57]|uniref:YiiD C-terminal domain-containing protein n=1 Tax=Desulfuromonas sp. CSMB_57 TaxID=2807629 RepID=UPI001CD2368C|nr:YiiD C-terminal domain-containing protein [Desulfuromonas sp. CSMB_57]